MPRVRSGGEESAVMCKAQDKLRKVPYYLLILWLTSGALVSLTLTVYNLNVLFLIEVQL